MEKNRFGGNGFSDPLGRTVNNAFAALAVAFALVRPCLGVESHADSIVARVLENAAKVRAAKPDAVVMAFWDFDGTIIKGDISEGTDFATGSRVKLYKGLIERSIEEGLNTVYPAEGGWRQYSERDYPRLNEIGRWIAWPYNAQMYYGQSLDKLDALCEAECDKVYRKWYFSSSMKMWRALEKAGVENYIVSASPELFVRNVAKSLGVPRWRCRGLRVAVDGGHVTTKVIYPIPNGEGKVENVREMVLSRPNGVAIAAFGNSYTSDGAFLRYIATQPSLPGGAKGTAVMINGGKKVAGYTEHFITVNQSETVWDATAAQPRATVKASDFGWNPTNSTRALQAALDSGARTVRIDRQPGEWLTTTLRVRSGTEVVFEDGVVVRALPGAFKGVTDSLISLRNVTNVVLRGEGKAVLRMNKADYQDETRYRHAEWRHCIGTQRADGLTVKDLTLEDSGGDGVYVNHCRDMLVENVTASGHNRQGISVISCDGLTVRKCRFLRTSGALPECGIDIEPHAAACQVKGVLIEDCDFDDNNCHGIAMNLSGLSSRSAPVSIVVRNCRARRNRHHGIWMTLARGTHEPAKGSILFENVRVEGNGSDPLSVQNLAQGSFGLTFRNCSFDGVPSKRGIALSNGATLLDFGKCTFEGCRLSILAGVEPMTFTGATGVGIAGLAGTLAVSEAGAERQMDLVSWGRRFKPKPELKTFKTQPCDVKRLTAVSPGSTIAEKFSPLIRGGASFVQLTPGAGEYPIRFRQAKIGRFAGSKESVVTVYDAQGTTHDQFTLKPCGETTTYILRAQGAHAYRFDVRCSNGFSVASALPGNGIVVDSRVDFFAGRNYSLWFCVPAGSEEAKVELTATPGEYVTADLVDPDGKVVDSCVKRDAATILAAKFAKTVEDRLWRLKIHRCLDDCRIRVGAPALPIVSWAEESAVKYVAKD